MQCLYLVLTIVVIQETSELNPDISKYNDWIKDAEATVKRIKAKEKSQAEYEMNKDTYIHDKRETDTVGVVQIALLRVIFIVPRRSSGTT